MCERFNLAMAKLNLSALELSRELGYTNVTTINKVQRGEAFVDTERLHILSMLKSPDGEHIDLNWLITGCSSYADAPIVQNNHSDQVSAVIEQQISSTSNNTNFAALQHFPELSYGEKNTGNLLIHGDNLDALEVLADKQPETVKCAYLDPPYNNGDSYLHYYDNLGHEEWLHGVTERLKLIKRLLKIDGSVWISIDDSELHYLKVAADNVFGRENFVGTVVWERRTTRENRKAFSRNHEYLLVYTKNIPAWTKSRNALPLTDDVKGRYKNPDQDPRGPWQSVSVNVQDGHATPSQFYELTAPNGRVHTPPKGRCWVYSKRKMLEEIEKNNIWFGKDGNGVPRIKKFLSERSDGLTPETLWRAENVGTTSDAKKQLLSLFRATTLFDTPKPEQLVHRILHISTNPGDLVLDPYLGSGTTTSVAHKMGRKYIGIEIGEHVKSHSILRLKQVVDGETGGISQQVNWKGGGGFDFYLLNKTEELGN